jgi:glutamate-1-semialdehyde 2,1-aminomutase
VDGNELIDYVLTWGPAILGHAHPKIIAAVKAAAELRHELRHPQSAGSHNGQADLRTGAQRAKSAHDQFSGTEACMSAIRLARGIHAARQDHQVRRLLPRPRGFAAGARGSAAR